MAIQYYLQENNLKGGGIIGQRVIMIRGDWGNRIFIPSPMDQDPQYR